MLIELAKMIYITMLVNMAAAATEYSSISNCGDNPFNCTCVPYNNIGIVYNQMLECPGPYSSKDFTIKTYLSYEYRLKNDPDPSMAVAVHCNTKGIQASDLHFLQRITLTQENLGIEYESLSFEFHDCPMPNTPFARLFQIGNNLQIRKIEAKRKKWDRSEDSLSNQLQGLSNLYYLDLSGYRLEYITPATLRHVPNLQILYLRNTHLMNITKEAIDQVTKLRYLDLSRNFISWLPPGVFSKLASLEALSLGENSLGNPTSSETFKNSTKSSGNEIPLENRSLSADIFEGLSNVFYLQLENNQLKYLPENIFRHLVNLQKLYLSKNKFGRLPSGIFKHATKLESLTISGNTENELILPDDFSDHMLSIRVLDLRNSGIKTLSENTFKGAKSVEKLLISNNKIETLPLSIFDHLEKVQELDLSNNQMKSIPGGLFANTFLLKKLNVSKNRLNFFHRDAFNEKSCENIVKLDLSENLITEAYTPWSYPLINCVDTSKQQFTIDLRHNRIKYVKIDCQLDARGSNIYLNNNNISAISLEYFELCDDFQDKWGSFGDSFYLKDNPIKSWKVQLDIDNLYCNSPLSLKERPLVNLSLSEVVCPVPCDKNGWSECPLCQFRPYDKAFLVNCQGMNLTEPPLRLPLHKESNHTILNISNNYITTFPSFVNEEYRLVTGLYAAHNRIRDFKISSIPQTLKVVHLNNNNISVIDWSGIENWMGNQNDYDKGHHETVLDLNTNPIMCDCQNYPLFQRIQETKQSNALVRGTLRFKVDNLHCSSPRTLQGRAVTEMPLTEVTCPIDCPESSPCQCQYRPSDQGILVNCGGMNLKSAPNKLPIHTNTSQIVLNISNNVITTLPTITQFGYRIVTELYASHNFINSLDVVSIPPDLKVLELDHNQLTMLHSGVVDYIGNMSHLRSTTFHGNSWMCECENVRFIEFVKEKAAKNQILFSDRVKCADGKQISKLSSAILCKPKLNTKTIIGISVSAVLALLCLLIIVVIYYKYKKEIIVWLFAHDMCMSWITEQELDKDKEYDAFICFSYKDEDFVEKELIPNLTSGPKPFKLCIHTQDWLPGEYITNQIVQSVENSRRTVIVLSPNFVESEWGKLEFRVAHAQSMKEGRARIIVILLADVGPTENLDSELQAYLNINTYVKWGDPKFWDKLRYALPHLPKKISLQEIGLQELQNRLDTSSDDDSLSLCASLSPSVKDILGDMDSQSMDSSDVAAMFLESRLSNSSQS